MTSAPSIELHRHYHELSANETDELAGALAGLVVDLVKRRPADNQQERPHEHGLEGRAKSSCGDPVLETPSHPAAGQ